MSDPDQHSLTDFRPFDLGLEERVSRNFIRCLKQLHKGSKNQ